MTRATLPAPHAPSVPGMRAGVRRVRGCLIGNPGAGYRTGPEGAGCAPPWEPRRAPWNPARVPGLPCGTRETAFSAPVRFIQRSSKDVTAGGSAWTPGTRPHQHVTSCQFAVSLPRRLLLADVPSRARTSPLKHSPETAGISAAPCNPCTGESPTPDAEALRRGYRGSRPNDGASIWIPADAPRAEMTFVARAVFSTSVIRRRAGGMFST
jgi:hypothetical protein